MARFLSGLLAALLLALPAFAQQPAAPLGVWRCVVNSPAVSIDLMMQVGPGGQLGGRGTIVYPSTGRIFNVEGPGDWTLMPPDASGPNWLFKFRMAPQNHAIFSWFASPTQTPGILYNQFRDPQTGGIIETSCQRQG